MHLGSRALHALFHLLGSIEILRDGWWWWPSSVGWAGEAWLLRWVRWDGVSCLDRAVARDTAGTCHVLNMCHGSSGTQLTESFTNPGHRPHFLIGKLEAQRGSGRWTDRDSRAEEVRQLRLSCALDAG